MKRYLNFNRKYTSDESIFSDNNFNALLALVAAGHLTRNEGESPQMIHHPFRHHITHGFQSSHIRGEVISFDIQEFFGF